MTITQNAKKHKRQVLRAKLQRKESSPDLRTPEQMQSDRNASLPGGSGHHSPPPPYRNGTRTAPGAPVRRPMKEPV